MARAPAKRASVGRASLGFDRVAAVLAALVIVGLAVFLLVRNEAIVSAQLFFVLRVVLSFATAVLGATIPGFLEIGWTGRGLAIRAGGALALFVLTYLYTPDLVTDQRQGGQITIGTPAASGAGAVTTTGPAMNTTIAPAAGGPSISAPGGVAAGSIGGGTFNIGGGREPRASGAASRP